MFGNLKEIPKPIGKYNVGITQMDFIDLNRKEVFEFENGDHRKIPVIIFYPIDNVQGKNTIKYSFPEAITALRKMTLGLVSSNVTNIKTHCYENVPISTNEKKYPIIFYNHAYASYIMQDTTLCSHLASVGFIVLSIGHPYESSAVKYLNGDIIKIHDDNYKNMKQPKSYNKYLKSIYNSTKEYSDKEAVEIADFLYNKHNHGLNNNVKIWVEDTLFIADQLDKINEGNINSIFKNRLKLDIGFGITGHSYGGAVAAQTCLADKRFKCGINIDGGTYGEYLNEDLKKPFMVIGSNVMKLVSRTPFIYNSEDTYMVLINKTEHFGYTDALFILRQLNILNLLGKREKYEFQKIYTQYNIEFFNKYLLGKRDIDLSALKYEGVEFLQKRKNINNCNN